MDFSWSETQRRLFDDLEAYIRAEVRTDVVAADREGRFDRAGWEAFGRFGLTGLPIPRSYGGRGCDALTTVGALERLGYVCADHGLMFTLHAHLWTVVIPLLAIGTEAQKGKYLPLLASGQWVGGNAMTEPGAGSDAFSLETTAHREGDSYILNGHKSFVSNAPIADLLTVYATVDRAQGPAGITVFLVETTRPGITIRPIEKMGLRTSPSGEVVFTDCRVPVFNRLGEEGAGGFVFMRSMTWERGCILATAVGAMRRMLEQCVRFARTRRQYGQAIGKYQQVAMRLVGMKERLEASRLLLYFIAWLLTEKRPAYMEAALTKRFISEAWVQTCEDAIQIHGSLGYRVESGIERELRDALGSRLYSGTNEIQANLVASLLGL
ncbi:MAG: acyl-CoA dehydrogenase family protein [Verrucomicrobiota bacterium]|nr:acyl-CoA dehydrogenase family protein [Limisphaera sp.]MDW8380814.1 acyl-CoA dehydrogenase family protein [Verrucomicrobiota bacterium]